MFSIFAQWFGQPLSFPFVAVNILFFLIGVWYLLVEWKNARRVLLYPVLLLVASLLIQYVPLFFCGLFAVLLCGFATMILLGMLAGVVLLHFLRYYASQDQHSSNAHRHNYHHHNHSDKDNPAA